jgi:hypothetical protein
MQRIVICTLMICVSLVVMGTPIVQGQQTSPANESHSEVSDSIQFLKRFHLGMTYDEVQQALPKTLQQDALAYSTRDGLFMLEVGKPTGGDWGAYLMFDTSDLEIKKPERLVEIDCSSTLPVTDETFESVVSRVSGSFGQPIKLDSTGRTSRAGWQTTGGSLLTVEYTRMAGAEPKTQCVVDFVIRSASRKSRETIA